MDVRTTSVQSSESDEKRCGHTATLPRWCQHETQDTRRMRARDRIIFIHKKPRCLNYIYNDEENSEEKTRRSRKRK